MLDYMKIAAKFDWKEIVMLTDDIRLERIEQEYSALRGTQDKMFDRMNGLGDVLQRLVDQVSANAAAIEVNREEILVIRRAVAENSQMLAAIIEHLDVPYRPMGFRGGE